jgi:hypothetical protein
LVLFLRRLLLALLLVFLAALVSHGASPLLLPVIVSRWMRCPVALLVGTSGRPGIGDDPLSKPCGRPAATAPWPPQGEAFPAGWRRALSVIPRPSPPSPFRQTPTDASSREDCPACGRRASS